MPTNASNSDDAEFDFDDWASAGLKRPSFGKCARQALGILAASEKDLRERLRGALSCLLFLMPEKIPLEFRERFDEIYEQVKLRLKDDWTWQSLDRYTTNLKLKTAKRLAFRVFELCVAAADRDRT